MNFLQIPWSRWVLPRPQLPWMNSGLYCTPGNSATYKAALWAMWLLGPTTNVSMSCRSLGRTVRLLSGADDSAAAVARPPAGLIIGGIVLIGWLTATALRVGRTVGDPSITGDIGRWWARDLSE